MPLNKVTRIIKKARKSFPVSKNRNNEEKGMDPFNTWAQGTPVQCCGGFGFCLLFVFTFLIEISTDKLTSNMKPVALFCNYIPHLLWEGTRLQNVHKLLVSKAILKYFCIGLTKPVYCRISWSYKLLSVWVRLIQNSEKLRQL